MKLVKFWQLGEVEVVERTARAPSICWLTIAIAVVVVAVLEVMSKELVSIGINEIAKMPRRNIETTISITPKPISAFAPRLCRIFPMIKIEDVASDFG